MLTDDGRTDGRTTDAWLYYKLAYEPKDSGELIKMCSSRLPQSVKAKRQLGTKFI